MFNATYLIAQNRINHRFLSNISHFKTFHIYLRDDFLGKLVGGVAPPFGGAVKKQQTLKEFI